MEFKHTNALANETSPYLLQHAHNPVNWYGWHPQVWQQARQHDKLAIISIGYSACHWCHVMEHESFEDETVAQIMNDHFISIKVDREERPDVDQIYMDACQLITGRGGWPLNAITLPDGRPLYAGTYFPRENWKQLLLYFVDYWKNQREDAFARAAEITNGIKTIDTIAPQPPATFAAADRDEIFKRLDATIDHERGGGTGAPKFPMPVKFRYLLRNYHYTGNTKALAAVTTTLNGMMDGGIYDHIGGGFARYSVDADWEIPHFEKMLYDNAQLVTLYSEAYSVTANPRYKEVVFETLAFVARELSDGAGGFYSALDADSEGEEGKFYVWQYDELKQVLSKEFKEFTRVFNVSEEGNFEGANNLTRKAGVNVSPEQLQAWKQKLLQVRSGRIRPGLDDKVLTAWNALMLKGYLDAYAAFGQQPFLERAVQCAGFIKQHMLHGQYGLMRNYKSGKATINGFLDDYSFTCEAFIALYEATFDEQWLKHAEGIAAYVIQHFYNLQNGLFFYTSVNDSPLITRKTETSDNVIPASNSSMCKALYRLGLLLGKDDYIDIAIKAAGAVKEHIYAYTGYYANWAMLADWIMDEPYVVAITGPDAMALRRGFNAHFLPHAVFMGSTHNSQLPLLKDKTNKGETLIYVCRNKACLMPVSNNKEALAQLAAGV